MGKALFCGAGDHRSSGSANGAVVGKGGGTGGGRDRPRCQDTANDFEALCLAVKIVPILLLGAYDHSARFTVERATLG